MKRKVKSQKSKIIANGRRSRTPEPLTPDIKSGRSAIINVETQHSGGVGFHFVQPNLLACLLTF
ncbi:MAG: hypothetical protein KME17_00080 [Cyanosarcina radialis HA8281-LM2]|nr:hypothetical protein [Cyanosarcina radialis HA8281-LM2]